MEILSTHFFIDIDCGIGADDTTGCAADTTGVVLDGISISFQVDMIANGDTFLGTNYYTNFAPFTYFGGYYYCSDGFCHCNLYYF